MSNTIQ